MNEQKKREAMARVEFGNKFIRFVPTTDMWVRTTAGARVFKRTYDSHDDVQRVIDGLDRTTLKKYVFELAHLKHMNDEVFIYDLMKQAVATPVKKVEAILRATGLWKKESDE